MHSAAPTETLNLQPVEPAGALVLKTRLPLEQNPAAVYLSSLSASGRRTQKTALDTVARLLCGDVTDAFSCNWGAVRYQHTAAIRTRLAEMYSPATANKTLSAVRRVLKEAWKLRFMSSEDFHRAESVSNITGEVLPAGRELDNGEIAALMNCCISDGGIAGIRDAATIALLYTGGLRRSEIVSLDWQDFSPLQNETDSGQLVIKGKRNKQRLVYISKGAFHALHDWVQIRGQGPGPLLCPINKKGLITYRRLSTQAIYNLLVKRAKQSQVNKFSPHDFRRTFVSDLLEAGADIAVVSKMAGHANIQTTARYDRRPEESKRKAARLLHIPYH